ncbi:TrmH family RNA methyltransferase [Elizabethkingia argentiflava]|uniref:tRNA (guanosine(18)-2'-O)-methyltransferase n=1 Tax=Elizabethkingia argenteiflava TaxID=2681556 RepID=A0A845PVU1_9FLAO|nr:RNA methyltransferase [Elizabethkingia argenteiflava]NAW50230.1 TrmH family RNA methyltransferase [Elizabethkingia argenteiflava]
MNQKDRQIYDYMKGFLTPERLSKIEKYAEESSDFILPVMENIYQFRNAAAIIRSVEACGFHKLVAFEEANAFTPNTRVARGADTWMQVEKMPASLSSLQNIRNRGYKILAVSPEKKAVSLPEYELDKPVALVFGTEMKGVSEEVLAFADETLMIPMYGFTQSFNVSVAAAICMYQMKQKLIHSDLQYKLSEDKKLALKIRWAVNSTRSGEEVLQHYLKTHHMEADF